MEAGKRGRNGQTNEPFWRSLAPADARCRVFQFVENTQSGLVKIPTCLSQCGRTRGAVNQLGAEIVLKGGDLFADGRLTNSTLLCDSGEAPFFNHPNENLHCIE